MQDKVTARNRLRPAGITFKIGLKKPDLGLGVGPALFEHGHDIGLAG